MRSSIKKPYDRKSRIHSPYGNWEHDLFVWQLEHDLFAIVDCVQAEIVEGQPIRQTVSNGE